MKFLSSGYGKVLSLVLVAALLVGTGVYIRYRTVAAGESVKEGVRTIDVAPYIESVIEATGDSGLDYNKATAIEYLDQVIVRIPGPNFGGAAVVLQDGKIVSVMEMTNTIKDGFVKSSSHLDGKQMASITINEKTGVIIDGWVMRGTEKVSVTDEVRTQFSWRCWSNCMADLMTVPNWVIGLVTSICALACYGTAGLGCLVCLQGAVIAYGAEAAFCHGYCRNAS